MISSFLILLTENDMEIEIIPNCGKDTGWQYTILIIIGVFVCVYVNIMPFSQCVCVCNSLSGCVR